MTIRILHLGFILFSILFTESACAQNEWHTYSTRIGQAFSVESPDDLVLKVKEIETAMGRMKTYTYALEPQEGDPNYLYVINIVDYPSETFPMDSTALINEFLKSSVSMAASGVEGEIAYSSDIEDVNNGVGKLYRIKFNDDYSVVKGKMFLKGDKFISLQVYTTQNNSLNPEMNFFLDSFLLK